MSTPDDSTRRTPADPTDPAVPDTAAGGATATGPTTGAASRPAGTATDLDGDGVVDGAEEDGDVLVVEDEPSGGGSAGPGLALAGLLTGLLALFFAGTESAVRECTPDPVGAVATGVDGYLTALLLAVVAVVLSAVGIALSRSSRWGGAVGVAGVVVGVLVVVVWLLSVWVLSADPVDIATITSQEQGLPLQGFGCA
ncbi:hypothetical protein [uncultured Pseudokineococcus sp.]|uniref:hypothetical protein n=1 Tax=uncultured Pseudokineococcus sp. TaxID=1642928 RepID=UPI002630ED8A|nr:hypothetical protein [uncultured Pseudokineococcus sp.]